MIGVNIEILNEHYQTLDPPGSMNMFSPDKTWSCVFYQIINV